MGYGLWVMGYGVWVKSYELWIMDYELSGEFWGVFFMEKARAYIFICLTMAVRPLERVGERCSRRPMASMKARSASRIS